MIDDEKLKKRQSLKVIVSEAIMVLFVVVIVVVLGFVVSGYWVNSDFEVERQGMLQVSSIPTGADLAVDGESSWLQRTNTSKVVAAGEHTVSITKEGYDTWQKTVNVTEGLLYRLHYPRLFLKDRKAEKVYNASNYNYATISPDGRRMLLASDKTKWQLVNMNSEKIEPKTIDFSEYLPGVSAINDSDIGLFSGSILEANWDKNGDHVLMEIKAGDQVEWLLLDVDNPKNSLNITRKFETNFDTVRILDDSASNLLTLRNGDLQKIDVPGRVISEVLAEKIISFDYYKQDIVYAMKAGDNNYTVGTFRIGDTKKTILSDNIKEPIAVVVYRFYDDMYVAILEGNVINTYKKAEFEQIKTYQLSFSPQELKVGHAGEFIMMVDAAKIAALDMEAGAVREWEVDGEKFDWLDSDMIYSVADGRLMVYDYDGLNRRELADNVSEHFPVTITENKWLYYFSDGVLMREQIVD